AELGLAGMVLSGAMHRVPGDEAVTPHPLAAGIVVRSAAHGATAAARESDDIPGVAAHLDPPREVHASRVDLFHRGHRPAKASGSGPLPAASSLSQRRTLMPHIEAASALR